MTNARFKELVNLFLDREISPRDLECLRRELGSAERKEEFQELRRIHTAEKQAIAMLSGGKCEPRQRSISKRACDAINDARVGFEERRKGLVLLSQFTAATAAIAMTVGFVYRGSVEALGVEEDPNARLVQANGIRFQPRATAAPTASIQRILVDRQGRAIALVSIDQSENVDVQPMQTVSEGGIFSLGKALESIKPEFPTCSELMESAPASNLTVYELPGTSAPIVFAEDQRGAGKVVGFAY
ncbi:MAG: hypothetical protein ACQKBV_04290 [Puniceicoccales bacterium]